MPHVWLTRLLPLTLVVLCGFAFAADSIQAQDAPRWKTGGVFSQQLHESVTFDLGQRPLREALLSLSQAYGVAVFLDRRIDPDEPITLSVRAQPLEEALRLIARAAKAEISLLGPVVYFGPPQAAQDLATLAALRKQDTADSKARLLRSAAMKWNELARPQALLDELGNQVGVKFENLDVVPLDLWPSVNLPPLPWTDRVTLLLIGFGLTFEFDSGATAARLIPAPDSPRIEHRYFHSNPAELAAKLRRALPDAQIRVEKNQLIVVARQEDHHIISRLFAGPSAEKARPTKSGGEKLYTLKLSSQPAGNVIQSVAKSIGKQPRYSPAVAEKLRQNVTFDVHEVSLGQLLDTTLKPLGLTYRLSEDVLEIIEQP